MRFTALLGMVWIGLGITAAAAAEKDVKHVQGTVVDSKRGEPLANTRIDIESFSPHLTVLTDANGKFRVDMTADQAETLNEESNELYCLVAPTDLQQWKMEFAIHDNVVMDFAQNEVLEYLDARVKGRWKKTKGQARLELVDVPSRGTLDLRVQGPDGGLLGNTPVEIYPTKGDPLKFDDKRTLKLSGKTDANGHAFLKFFPGVQRLRVVVRGVGFTSTGLMEILGNSKAEAVLPPLARFATVEGVVDADLLKPGCVVTFESGAWNLRRGACDAKGHFRLQDVSPGVRLRLEVGDQEIPTSRSVIFVAPGAKVRDIRISKPEQNIGGTSPPPPVASSPPPPKPPSILGKVQDQRGRPLAGVKIHAVCNYYGGMRMARQDFSTVTDSNGNYGITNLPTSRFGGGTGVAIVASVEGKPPAFDCIEVGTPPNPKEPGNENLSTLTIPDQGGDLHVKVISEEKSSVTNAMVHVQMMNDPFSTGWPLGRAGLAAGDEQIFSPSHATDGQGEAQFSKLLPGLYDISVGGERSGASLGIRVLPGKTTAHTMVVAVHDYARAFKLRGPAGKVIANRSVEISFGRANEGAGGGSTGIDLGQNGDGNYGLGGPGFWNVLLRFRDSPLESISVTDEPYNVAEATLAVSDATGKPQAVEMTAVRKSSGSIQAELVGANGKPAKGTVLILDFGEQAPDYAGSTSEQGKIHFPNMTSGEYRLCGYMEGLAEPPDLGDGSAPFPGSEKLAHVAMLPPQSVQVESGKETKVTMRAQRAGYVRGKFSPEPNTKLQDYTFSVEDPDHIAGWAFDSRTGDFILGPVFSGKASLLLYRNLAVGKVDLVGRTIIEAPGGEVRQLDLTPTSFSKPAEIPPASFETSGWGLLDGSVFLSDGKTPAFGARVLRIPYSTPQPSGSGFVDVLGMFHTQNLGIISSTNEGVDDPKGDLVVARFPGLCGATVMQLKKGEGHKLSIVLPRPISLSGSVTLAGHSIEGHPQQFHVIAACQTMGRLNKLLSVETSADATGAFELAGLTPGKYQVQAAMDDIWFSKVVEITADEKPLDPVHLDIEQPGAPVRVKLVDGHGKPLLDTEVELERLPGPMTQRLCPKSMKTDGAGILILEGQAAGTIKFHLSSNKRSYEVQIPLLNKNTDVRRQVIVCE